MLRRECQPRPREELAGLVFIECQVACADLGEVPADPQALQAQRGVSTADQHQSKRGHRPLDEAAQAVEYLSLRDLVQVVEH